MQSFTTALLLTLVSAAFAADHCPATLDFRKRVLAGDEEIHLCEAYQGKAVLVVNTASRCAYTDQYEGLEDIYAKYRDRGLMVLGFPSNDFGAQEPGSEDQIKEFCRLTYDVKFPMFEKTHAKEGVADPLFQTLAKLAGEYPKWNFHKYLIGPGGQLLNSYRSHVDPKDKTLVSDIERSLADASGVNE